MTTGLCRPQRLLRVFGRTLPLALAITPAALAQPPRDAAAPGPQALTIHDRVAQEAPPSPAQTMRAYKALESWIQAWQVPAENTPEAVTAADGQALPPVYGACINLRLHGQLIGRGVAMVGSSADPPDARLLARAAAEARRAAERRLPVPNDLMRDEAIRQLTPSIQISLELAGAPIPITADTWSLIDQFLAPGLDGLFAAVGDQPAPSAADSPIAFPSAMMMSNLLPQKALRGVAAKALGEGGATKVLETPRELRERHALRLYRFRVSHLAQPAPGAEPIFLYRGARIIELSSLTPAALRDMADNAAAWLRTRLHDSDHTALRTQEPLSTMRAETSTAAGSELLAALALARHARLTGDAASSSAASRVLDQAKVATPETQPTDQPATVHNALLLLAAVESGDHAALASDAAAAVHAAFDDQGSPHGVTGPARSLVVAAAAHATAARVPGATLDLAGRAVSLGLLDAQGNVVTHTPWLGWAACDVWPAPGEFPAAVAFRQMRKEVWDHQLSPLDAGDDGVDLVGGIVFTSGNITPLPTWQAVRPLAFIATMLGDQRLTEPHERNLELARLLQAFRFLRQLQVDDACGWMYPDPSAAVGGIRSATWDHTLHPDATSLTLLAVCQMLESMDRLARDSAGEPAEGGAGGSGKNPQNPAEK